MTDTSTHAVSISAVVGELDAASLLLASACRPPTSGVGFSLGLDRSRSTIGLHCARINIERVEPTNPVQHVRRPPRARVIRGLGRLLLVTPLKWYQTIGCTFGYHLRTHVLSFRVSFTICLFGGGWGIGGKAWVPPRPTFVDA